MAATDVTGARPEPERTGLHAAGAKAREAALLQLPMESGEAVDEVVDLLRTDPNDNVRRTAADVLATTPEPGRAKAAEALLAVVTDTEAALFVRESATRSLGALRVDVAVPTLAASATGDNPVRLKHASVDALEAIASPQAADALVALAPELDGKLLARVILVTAKLRAAGAPGVIEHGSASTDDRVRKAAIRATSELRPANAVAVLRRLADDPQGSVRARSLEALAGFDGDGVEAALVHALVLDADETVRSSAAHAAAGRPPSSTLMPVLVSLLRSESVARKSLDLDAIALALGSGIRDGTPQGTTDADTLVAAALDGDEELCKSLAAVLTACCGHDPDDAGKLLNAYGQKHPEATEQLGKVRIVLGGRTALDPILKQLQANLETYFQIPIHELNTDTRESWQAAIDRARQAFMVRMVMSVAVFSLGALLVIVSAGQFFFGDLDTQAMWGAGVSFVGGLAAMLTITYTGPLKDIGQSVRDLGAATAAFIGYVHEVSEISHTFSALYLRQQIDFDDMEKACKLLRAATKDTIASLDPPSK